MSLNNQQKIFLAAKGEGLPEQAAILLADQAMHESGNFKSNVFLTDNNAYGMKVPKIRKSPYIAGPSTIVMKSEGSTPYAHYNSVEDSTKDLIHWLKYNGVDWSKIIIEDDPDASAANYADFLKDNGYYGDDQQVYTNALIRNFYNAKKAIGDVINRNQGAVVASGVTIVLMAVYFIVRVAKARAKK